MIRISEVELSASALLALAEYQAYVNNGEDFAEKVSRASIRFSSANVPANATFTEIRHKLSSMCSGAKRCMYCEDSVADEVEHHHPKQVYPEQCFSWPNYLYACGPCNSPKNNRFAVYLQTEHVVDVTPKRGAPPKEPVVGRAMLIHPRLEDPLNHLFLDLAGATFLFTPHPLLTGIEAARARYSIDLLKLNTRDYLIEARQDAFESYLARLRDYVNQKVLGKPQADLVRMKEAVLRMHHPTVFREMLRQAPRLNSMSQVVGILPEFAFTS